MKQILLIACCLWSVTWLLAEEDDEAPQPAKKGRGTSPAPDVRNHAYGEHKDQILDFWKAKSEKPAPVLVFIHGGGFRAGSKDAFNPALLQKCLESGISFASVEYRLSGVAPYPAQMHDCARAIQYIRHKAAEWNADPQRIAATGGSAGAGLSQWLAFHDDMADATSNDPVLKQSTRLTCAIPTNAQCTYDPREIKKIVPGNAYNHPALKQLHGLPATFNWDKDAIDAKLDAALKDCSPITHLTKDDPPIMILNSKKAEQDGNIHHPNFGRHLKTLMDPLGIECVQKVEGEPVDLMMEFLKKHLTK